jgi:hypothetical protein
MYIHARAIGRASLFVAHLVVYMRLRAPPYILLYAMLFMFSLIDGARVSIILV